jgi:hypothetical protein
MSKREEIAEDYPDLLVMDPEYLDEAIIGVATRIGLEAVCYDTEKVIELLMKHDGMDYEEAVEYMDFNMKGAWVGETTPVFLG